MLKCDNEQILCHFRRSPIVGNAILEGLSYPEAFFYGPKNFLIVFFFAGVIHLLCRNTDDIPKTPQT